MRQTLLEIVQSILSSMDSDEVNSISDTVEAQQVAAIVQETYNYLVSSINLPEHYSLFELQASGDPNLPVVMYLPSNVLELKYLKYDTVLTDEDGPIYKEVWPLELTEFLNRMYNLSSSNSNVGTATLTANSEDFPILFNNDRAPQYYTSFDDYSLLFDAYNSDEDTTLQKSKTVAFGRLSPSFSLTDSFTPDLDPEHFTLLLNESKAQAFAELKQLENRTAVARARRGWIRTQDANNFPGNYYDRLPNYARRR
jgi:hypothetical protein